MWIDNKQISEFYKTPLGKYVTRRTRASVSRHVPTPKPRRVLGIGYLQHLLKNSFDPSSFEACILGVPKYMGVDKDSLPENLETIIVDDEQLPFDDCSFDLIVALHSFENGHHQEHALREMWRVLDHKGTIILIVPHKMSMWCRYDASPFSHGNAFTTSQLAHIFQGSNFTPIGFEKFLFAPPIKYFRFVKTHLFLDRILGFCMPTGGLILGAAEKRLLIQPNKEKEPSLADWLRRKIIPGSSNRNYRE